MHFVERHRDQAIIINGHIRVTVLEVHDDEVTVAIESDGDPGMNRIETLRRVNSGAQLELVGAFG